MTKKRLTSQEVQDILQEAKKRPVLQPFDNVQIVADKRNKELPKKKISIYYNKESSVRIIAKEEAKRLLEEKIGSISTQKKHALESLKTYNGKLPKILRLSKTEKKHTTSDTEADQFKVYRIGDCLTEGKVKMHYIGLDIGTKTVVVAYRNGDKTEYISEINGYWPFERSTPFIENMLNDEKKVRSDGTKRPARYIKLESGEIIVLGRDAEEFAYAKNDTLLRPMAEGGITPDEQAMTVLASIVHGLLQTAENDIGEFSEDVILCYCTTAPAINKTTNIPYHERVVNLILDGYESKSSIKHMTIKESHAIVLNMSEDGSGIGISWGAGTVTVSYVKYGIEIYSFCWVGSGDWIDEQVAMRHGFDPERSKTKSKTAKETPTTVSKRKMTVDLTPGSEPIDRIGLDIVLHYDVLISQVIEGIVQGFNEHEAQAKIDGGINIYMAGGTSSPIGFCERVKSKFEEKECPFDIANVLRHERPLYCVAEGCLKAAEMS